MAPDKQARGRQSSTAKYKTEKRHSRRTTKDVSCIRNSSHIKEVGRVHMIDLLTVRIEINLCQGAIQVHVPAVHKQVLPSCVAGLSR